MPERQARQTLRQTLWLIREKFGDDVLVTTGGEVGLGDRVESDRDRFWEAAGTGAWAAAAAYSGPFAAAAREAELLRRRFLDVATRLLPDVIKTGTGDAAWRLVRGTEQRPNRPPATLEQILEVVRSNAGRPLLFHCASGNRVGGALLPHFILDHGMSEDDAIQAAMRIGLRGGDVLEWGLDYARRLPEAVATTP